MKRKVKHFDLIDISNDLIHKKNLTASDIGDLFNVDSSNVHKYCKSGFLIDKKYKIREIATEVTIDKETKFRIEWDKARFKLNPNARRY